MIVIITNTHAHRLLQGGIVQSAPVLESGIGNSKLYSFLEKEFEQTDGASMNMTGGDTEEVKHQLQRLNQIFQGFYEIPRSNEAVAEHGPSGSDVM
jgi:hypothetical protein